MLQDREPEDRMYLEIAEAVSKRHRCLKRGYGAVLVKYENIIGIGWNGPYEKLNACRSCNREEAPTGTSYDKCPAIHAEERAIINAAQSGHDIRGSVLYLYGEFGPCVKCRNLLWEAGIYTIIRKPRKWIE